MPCGGAATHWSYSITVAACNSLVWTRHRAHTRELPPRATAGAKAASSSIFENLPCFSHCITHCGAQRWRTLFAGLEPGMEFNCGANRERSHNSANNWVLFWFVCFHGASISDALRGWEGCWSQDQPRCKEKAEIPDPWLTPVMVEKPHRVLHGTLKSAAPRRPENSLLELSGLRGTHRLKWIVGLSPRFTEGDYRPNARTKGRLIM